MSEKKIELSSSLEDYLETIFMVAEEKGAALKNLVAAAKQLRA
ncbi:helix-turn-helix domain-containing protein [Tichowtungia aerotolerans]|uniref:Uncharacterized protein n=1 Tax=Tichowtungia aerotolerans TaxID=2697043 RepID=A0A6P1M0J2_9BACT|nr:hypothetical protein [Tichowtungia aerotolerans]QHI68309.1 hypothetical protein GT409_02165 [Tichowtungia aerotolerans]